MQLGIRTSSHTLSKKQTPSASLRSTPFAMEPMFINLSARFINLGKRRQVARHTPEHARAAADAGALPALVAAEAATGASEDLRAKCRKALKLAVAHMTYLPALDALAQRCGLPQP